MNQKTSNYPVWVICLLIVLAFEWTGCNNEETTATTNIVSDTTEHEWEQKEPGKVTIVSDGMNFKIADSIYAGWNTFLYKNKSTDTHFFILEKYPEGKTIKDAENEVGPVFQKAMDSITSGNAKAGFAVFGELPTWYSDVKFMGGSGLIAPGHTAQTTLNLAPGLYVMECYVKMPNGKFHSSMGMTAQVIVRSDDSGANPPEATDEINISSAKGFDVPSSLQSGAHVFAVHFLDQKVYDNFVGHDIHLVRLNPGANTSQLEAWMNWLNPEGFISPTPGNIEFLGGVNDSPAGSTGYFSAELSPGKYAFVAEIPDAAKKNMLQTFVVDSATTKTTTQ